MLYRFYILFGILCLGSNFSPAQPSGSPSGHSLNCVILEEPGFEPSSGSYTVSWEKDGNNSWAATVEWTPPPLSHGYYSEQGWLGPKLAFYAEGYKPNPQIKTYTLHSGRSITVHPDSFFAMYRDPCARPSTIGTLLYGNSWNGGDQTIQAPHTEGPEDPDPTEPDDPENTDNYTQDPYQKKSETPTGSDCSIPFTPEECSPYDHPDTRIAADLPSPSGVELVAENITFDHQKAGFVAYNYDPESTTKPKYFLQEFARTFLTEGNPESPVGGAIIRRVCQMTGTEITIARVGNPSWYGARSGPDISLTENTASGSMMVKSYDDCPNSEDDEPGTLHFASILTDEYTKVRMRDDAFHYAWNFKGNTYLKQETPTAALLIDEKEEKIKYQKTKYMIRIGRDIPKPYKAVWVEEFSPEDTNLKDEKIPDKIYKIKSELIEGDKSSLYTIDPAKISDKEGSWWVFLLPVDITVAFGLGPEPLGEQTSRELLEEYLETIKVSRTGDTWLVKFTDAQGVQKLHGVEIVTIKEKLIDSLKRAGQKVVFDGHSNFGLGPNLSGKVTHKTIADFTHFGVGKTSIPKSFRGDGTETDIVPFANGDGTTLPTNPQDLAAIDRVYSEGWAYLKLEPGHIIEAPENYQITELGIERFKNVQGVAPGSTFTKQGNGFNNEWHFDNLEGSRRLIVLAPSTDIPTLGYAKFFYNACNTGRDYIESFKHGDFIYTKDSCRVETATTIFVQGIIEGKSNDQIMTDLNQNGVGNAGDQSPQIYGYKTF